MTRGFCILFFLLPVLGSAGPFDKGGINGVGARSMGMGGAVAAQGSDPSSLWWNPAASALQKDFELYYQNASVLGGNSQDHVVAHRGKLPDLDFSYGLGYRRNLATASSGFTEQTSLFSAALPFTDDGRLNFGASLKLYDTQLNNVPGGEAHGFGMDMGFLYNPPLPGNGLTLGLAVLDFQSGLDWATGFADSPAQLLQLGAAYRFDKSTITEIDSEIVTDHIHPTRSHQGFRLGVERWFGLKSAENLLALRLGYLQSSALAPTSLSGIFTAGLGLQWRGASIDYAYLQDVSKLGESHRISGSYRFDPWASQAAPKPSRTATAAASPSPSPTPRATASPEPISLESGLQPDADVFAPGSSSRRQNVNFGIAPGRPPLRGYSLVITRQGSLQPLRTLKGKSLPKSIRWDGKNQQGKVVPDGSYVATLRAVPLSGAPLVWSARVDVDTRRPTLSLGAYPRIFEPGNESRAVGFDLKTEKLTGIPARWELLVESLDGKRVKLFEGKGAPPEKQHWPGTSDRGEPVPNESLFYASYLLETESGAVAKTSRQVLGSEVTAFKEQSAIKVTLATAKFSPEDEGVALEDYQGLKEAAEAVKKYGAEYLLQVLGHADSQEAKGPVSALELSYLRAKAVRDYLVDSGTLDPARVKAMGFGAERPAADNGSEEGRAKNRRVEVILFTK